MIAKLLASTPPAKRITAFVLVAVGLTFSAVSVTTAHAEFGFLPGAEGFDGGFTTLAGAPETQAGSHPYQMTTEFRLKTIGVGEAPDGGSLKDVEVALPAGFVGDPTATPRCATSEFTRQSEEGPGGQNNIHAACPDGTAVGWADLGPTILPQFVPVYNLEPPAGVPAVIGFNPVGLAPIFIDVHVRTGGDYGLTAKVTEVSQAEPLTQTKLTLWGVPADRSHDTLRGSCLSALFGESLGTCPANVPAKPFLTLPSACSGALATSIRADSWSSPGSFVSDSFLTHDSSSTPVGNDGCHNLPFEPSITVQPDTKEADASAGLHVHVHIPQNSNPTGVASANLKTAVVKLPAGLSVNPAAADGLAGCSESQIGLDNASDPTCPDASKIGTVEVHTPVLPDALQGSVYVAQQGNLPGNGSNPFGSLLAIYVTVEGAGVLVKLAGHVEADPVTGQLTTTFDDNPQLPFSDFELTFFGGPRGVLATPESCGTFATESALAPWSGTPAVGSSQPFAINSGCQSGFTPSYTAGTESNRAGAFSPLSLTFGRSAQSPELGGIDVNMPPGLLGMLSSVPLCAEPAASVGGCSPASQIGHVVATAGAGATPLTVPQPGQPAAPVYLTGPYKGAPFGLSVVVPAIAGPFNLGNIVVRAAIHIDSRTAAVTVVSDPLPTIVQGIPLRIRSVDVQIDRPQFIFNPTSCEPLALGATISSVGGAGASVGSRFQAADCEALPFTPRFSASTQAKTSKASGAALEVSVTQKPGEANIHRVAVKLPLALPSRLTTLQKACTEAQFASNPAGCPAASTVGSATAVTPTLNAPLTGPAYLVSHGGAAFPDLVLLLQGQGVKIELIGNTDIKRGVTSSTFAAVPDAPISSVNLKLPQGPFSVLAANGSLCASKLIMPTTITGQNGKQFTQDTPISAVGCPKPAVRLARIVQKPGQIAITVTTTASGALTVGGSGLKTIRRTLAAGTHRLRVLRTLRGRRSVRRGGASTALRVKLTTAHGAATRTVRLRG